MPSDTENFVEKPCVALVFQRITFPSSPTSTVNDCAESLVSPPIKTFASPFASSEWSASKMRFELFVNPTDTPLSLSQLFTVTSLVQTPSPFLSQVSVPAVPVIVKQSTPSSLIVNSPSVKRLESSFDASFNQPEMSSLSASVLNENNLYVLPTTVPSRSIVTDVQSVVLKPSTALAVSSLKPLSAIVPPSNTRSENVTPLAVVPEISTRASSPESVRFETVPPSTTSEPPVANVAPFMSSVPVPVFTSATVFSVPAKLPSATETRVLALAPDSVPSASTAMEENAMF